MTSKVSAPVPLPHAKPVAQETTTGIAWWYYLLEPAFVIYAIYMRMGLGLYWGQIFVGYGLIPLLDQLLPQDWKNPTFQQIMELERSQRYRLMLYFMVVLDTYIFFVELGTVNSFTLFNFLPRIFALANVYSNGMVLSHELMHKENIIDRSIGALILIKNCYLHFYVEHNYGHHKFVSTPLDPASAQKGISIYEFMPKSIKGGFLSAYKINPRFVVLSTIASGMFVLVIYKMFGWIAMIVHILSAIGSIALLETTNYIEHYGLQRKRLPDGTYEKVTIRHSWNAAHVVSNYLMLKLQRHSDHHENSLKPYQTLCTYEDSPQLPHGYLTCIIMAQFPEVWFDVMDPLVDEYNKEGSTKGTELAALKVAEEKAFAFTRKLFTVTAVFMGVDIIQKLTGY